MLGKRKQMTADDTFESICKPYASDVNKNGVAPRPGYEIDWTDSDFRWQVCYSLDFLRREAWFAKSKKKSKTHVAVIL